MQSEAGLSQAQPQHLQGIQQQSASASRDGCAPAASMPVFSELLSYAVSSALRLYANLANAWPEAVFVTEVVPEVTHPVLQLSWVTIRYTDAQLQQADVSWSASKPTREVLVQLAELCRVAVNAAVVATHPITIQDQPSTAAHQHLAHVRASPHALPCAAYLTAVCVYKLLLAQLPHLPSVPGAADSTGGSDGGVGSSSGGGSIAGSSSGGSSSRSTSGQQGHNSSSASRAPNCQGWGRWVVAAGVAEADATAAEVAAAWKQASKQLSFVPSLQRLLLQQLGISPASVLLCAADELQHSVGAGSAASNQGPGSSSSTGSSRGSNSSAAYCVSEAQACRLYSGLATQCFRFIQLVQDGAANRPPADLQLSLSSAPGVPHSVIDSTTTATAVVGMLLAHLLLYWCAHQKNLERVARGTPQATECSDVAYAALVALSKARVSASLPDSALQCVWQRVRKELPQLVTLVAANVLSSPQLRVGVGNTSSSAPVTAFHLAQVMCMLSIDVLQSRA